MLRPQPQERLAPCCTGCVSGSDVRGWISIVAQRRQLGLSDLEAYERAWGILAAVNPFPASLGRICPHPCEAGCNRTVKDGPVAINALERFLGDWALEHQMPLPRLEAHGCRQESLGVIGAGPAGLSFAYQMARRGYPVTVYEKQERPGGMLYYGIPQYRLPEDVLAAEVHRILDLGIDLQLNTAVGRDIPVSALRQRHVNLFLGIGAGRALKLGVPGEDGTGTWTGTDYLFRVNRGEEVALGGQVIVVGGGNTAMDAARTARRTGACVTILYRRTREEMPAIDAEIDDALAEGVQIEFLTAPIRMMRDTGRVRAVVVRRMRPGEPDTSGRRAPVPVPGSEYEMPAESVIAAVSQQPDWDGITELKPEEDWAEASASGECRDGLWAGGDFLGLGVAGLAIRQGREAAEAVHNRLVGLPAPAARQQHAVASSAVKPDFYDERERVALPRRPVAERIASPEAEIQGTISEQEFLREAARCFSCGLCYGCERCFMYCNAEGFTRLVPAGPGAYFAQSPERCLACGKCIDLCPCGFLSPGPRTDPVQ